MPYYFNMVKDKGVKTEWAPELSLIHIWVSGDLSAGVEGHPTMYDFQCGSDAPGILGRQSLGIIYKKE